MCGRFTQIIGTFDYFEALFAQFSSFGEYDNVPINCYNITPHTKVRLFRPTPKGITMDSVRWGWKPQWATGIKRPINARSETVATNKFYKTIWENRCIIPANGWYEWDNRNNIKQPYYIQLKTDKPMFFAGIGEFAGNEENDGFVIITEDAKGDLADIHDRHPVVFTPKQARLWLSDITSKQAEKIIKNSCDETNFKWHPVDQAVGNVTNEGAKLIQPKEANDLFSQ